MDNTWLQARIDATKAQIEAYDAAITALSSGVQSYTIDTQQTRQTVTRADVADIQKTIDILYGRLAALTARLNGTGTVSVRPAW
jgi:hypothetical protein